MLPRLESELLRTFLVIAETGNVTRAAEVLGRTQSAISMQVRRLEEVIGEPLFARGPRGVSLSPHGERLVPLAQRIVGLIDETTVAMRSAPLDGPVRVGIPEEYTQNVLPRALAAFAECHPATEVTVLCGHSRQLTDAIDRDELDIAVVFDWRGKQKGEVLCVDPTVWVTSCAHDVHLVRPVPIAVYRNSDWYRDFAVRSLEHHAIAFREAFSCDTCGGLKTAAEAGLAIAPLARTNIPPSCRELTQEDGFPPVDSSRVVLKRNPRRASAAIASMAEVVRNAFQPNTADGRAQPGGRIQAVATTPERVEYG